VTGPDEAYRIGVAGPFSPREFSADLGVAPHDLPPGMGGTPVNHLVRALLAAGKKVAVATLDITVDVVEPIVYEGSMLSVAIGTYRPKRRARDLFKVERKAVTEGLLLQEPAVVSAHWTYEYALGAIATGLPTLVTVHDVPRIVFRMQPRLYRAVRWWLHSRALAGATQVAFNSPYTRSAFGRRWQNRPLLPNFLPDEQFVIEDRTPPRPESPRFVSVNNGFGVRKNVGRLLEAFATVRRSAPAARLSLIGTEFEPHGPAWRWARKRGLLEGVDFVGPLSYEAMLDSLATADVLVHPSLEETFGYTLVEAASVGTPVIAGRSSGAVPWVLAEGEAGVLVDVRDVDELAGAMLELTQDEGRWRRLRQQAFTSMRDSFSASAVSQRYLDELSQLVTARGSP